MRTNSEITLRMNFTVCITGFRAAAIGRFYWKTPADVSSMM